MGSMDPHNKPVASEAQAHLVKAQEAHFAHRAGSWTDRYRTSPSFQSRLRVVGRALQGELRSRPNARVLDFGGGTGVFSALAAHYASFTVCVDRSSSMLMEGADASRIGRQILEPAGFSGSRSGFSRVIGDERCIADRPTFDVILAIALLEYVPDVAVLVDRLAALLRPGGVILVTVPEQRSPLRQLQKAALPLLAKGASRSAHLRDQEFVGLLPNGDDLRWEPVIAAAALEVQSVTPIPLGLTGWRRLVHPSVLLSLGHFVRTASHGDMTERPISTGSIGFELRRAIRRRP